MIVHIMPTYLFIYTYSHTHTLPRRLGTGKEINSSSRKFNKKSLLSNQCLEKERTCVQTEKGGEMKGFGEKEVSWYQDRFEGLQEVCEKGCGP